MQVERFAEGFLFTESPRWHGGAVWVADLRAKTICRLNGDGQSEVVVTFDANDAPGGFGWRNDETLVVVGMESRRLYEVGSGLLTSFVDLSRQSPHGCNDLGLDPDGGAYIGCDGFNAFAGEPAAPGSVLYVSPVGEVSTVAVDLFMPNGISVSSDGADVVVAETFASRISRYDRRRDGSLVNRDMWILDSAAGHKRSYPDGLCRDAEGGTWIADWRAKRVVRMLPRGRITDELVFDIYPTSVVLGGDNKCTLFVSLIAHVGGPVPGSSADDPVVKLRDPSGSVVEMRRSEIPRLARIDRAEVAVPGAGFP